MSSEPTTPVPDEVPDETPNQDDTKQEPDAPEETIGE